MNMAYTMAVKSNCISRQVGAVIVGPDGYVVGAGWNDVAKGKISCGLRVIRDLVPHQEFSKIAMALLKKDEQEPTKKDVRELVKQICDLLPNQKSDIPSDQFCFCFKDEMVKRDVTPRLVEALFAKVEDAFNDLRSSEHERMKSVSEEEFKEAKEMAKKEGSQILEELSYL